MFDGHHDLVFFKILIQKNQVYYKNHWNALSINKSYIKKTCFHNPKPKTINNIYNSKLSFNQHLHIIEIIIHLLISMK